MSLLQRVFWRRAQRSNQRQPRRSARRTGVERLEDRQMLAADFVSAFALAGNDHQTAIAVATDAAGDRFVAGHFKGTADFDPSPATSYLITNPGTTFNSFDAFIAKYAANGTPLWVRQITGSNSESNQTVSSVTVDPQGDAWAVLTIDADATDLGSGFAIPAATGSRTVLAKFDGATGATEFAQLLTARTLNVHFDSSGARFVSGAFDSPSLNLGGATLNRSGGNARDGFVAKYNATGSLVWARQFAGSVSSAMVQTDTLGNVVVSGSLTNRTDFDPGNGRYILSASGLYVVKLNSAGNFVWAGEIAASSTIQGGHVVNADGSIVLGGSYSGSVDFDPAKAKSLLTADSGSNSLFLAKLNANGTFAWAKKESTGGATMNVGLVGGSGGQFYLGGVFQGTVDFDPSAVVDAYTADNWGDVFVTRYDFAGNYAWSAVVGAPNIQGVYGPLAIDATGDLVVVGDFRETADFDPGSGAALMTSVDHRDAFILTLRDAPPAAVAASVVVSARVSVPETVRRARLSATRAVFAASQRENWRPRQSSQVPASPTLHARRHAPRNTFDVAPNTIHDSQYPL